MPSPMSLEQIREQSMVTMQEITQIWRKLDLEEDVLPPHGHLGARRCSATAQQRAPRVYKFIAGRWLI